MEISGADHGSYQTNKTKVQKVFIPLWQKGELYWKEEHNWKIIIFLSFLWIDPDREYNQIAISQGNFSTCLLSLYWLQWFLYFQPYHSVKELEQRKTIPKYRWFSAAKNSGLKNLPLWNQNWRYFITDFLLLSLLLSLSLTI